MQKKRKIRKKGLDSQIKLAKKDKDKSEECSEIIEKKSDNKATNYFDSDY